MTRTLAHLVADAAARRPDHDALVGPAGRRTWREYDAGSAAVAGALVRAGVRPGDRVAVGFAKDVHSFVAFHGCLRAGAVVVPLDPLSPPLVARAVLADADVRAVFADAERCRQLDPWSVDGADLRLVCTTPALDGTIAWDDLGGSEPADRLPPVGPADPAYIIYTSGSTGRPKGIVHTHASAMAYAERAANARGLHADDRVAGLSPLHFDISTLELYAAPLVGATVVVVGEPVLKFPASFTALSERERVTVWYFVPSFFRQVVERGALDQRDLSTLRLVMIGGEPYPPGALAALMDALPGASVENIYGPAEVNECTSHVVTRADLTGGDIPIGRPWSGVDLAVVDRDGREVAPGEPGELWISAPTVMAGYWRRDDLTARALRPRSAAPPWYASGDLVVIDHDGVAWFKGRIDHQVKVRGVRVELEAVEAVVADAPGVLHAVAVPLGAAGEVSHLLAVVVPRDGATIDPEEVKRHCRPLLAPVAVPHDVVVVDDLPTTPSGKIDRRLTRQRHGGSLAAEEVART